MAIDLGGDVNAGNDEVSQNLPIGTRFAIQLPQYGNNIARLRNCGVQIYGKPTKFSFTKKKSQKTLLLFCLDLFFFLHLHQ